MTLSDYITPECVAADLRASGKKQLFQEMANLMVNCSHLSTQDIHTRKIVAAVMERERLGTTGVGYGVALPHAKLPMIDRVVVAFARLESPIEYEAIDNRPVDLVALIIAPEAAAGEHLRVLAQISRRLRKIETRSRLRSAPNTESLYTTLIDDRQANAA